MICGCRCREHRSGAKHHAGIIFSINRMYTYFFKKMSSESGSTMVELALVAVALVPFLTVGYEAWRIVRLNAALEDLTRTAARYASMQEPPLSQIESNTAAYVQNSLIGSSPLSTYAGELQVNIAHLGTEVGQGGTGGGGGRGAADLDLDPANAVSPGDVMEMATRIPDGFRSFLMSGPVERSMIYTQMNETVGDPIVADPPPPPVCCEWSWVCQGVPLVCEEQCTGYC